MTDLLLFPFADYWWVYAGFTLFVLAVLALDLGVFHRKAHEVALREAAIVERGLGGARAGLQLPVLPLPALAPAAGAGARGARPRQLASETALEFLAGYVVE